MSHATGIDDRRRCLAITISGDAADVVSSWASYRAATARHDGAADYWPVLTARRPLREHHARRCRFLTAEAYADIRRRRYADTGSRCAGAASGGSADGRISIERAREATTAHAAAGHPGMPRPFDKTLPRAAKRRRHSRRPFYRDASRAGLPGRARPRAARARRADYRFFVGSKRPALFYYSRLPTKRRFHGGNSLLNSSRARDRNADAAQ